jgi:hypothetical protein
VLLVTPIEASVRALCSIVLIALGVSLLGCGPKTVWSTTAVSPDGKWVASGRTQMWSGPGIGTVESSVQLARSDKPNDRTEIISYPEGASVARPQIEWTSAQELIVRVPNPAALDFQAVKFAHIRITVDTIVSAVSDSSAPPAH